MELPSTIKFADEDLKKEFFSLNGPQDERLRKAFEETFKELEKDAFSGIQLPKRLIPREYKRKFGELANLWKCNLPDGWRLIYTIKRDEVIVLSIILEWMKHKEYERRFKY